MKTSPPPLFRKAYMHISYILVFLFTALSASAQCPTVTTPNPNPICDAAGLTFADLNIYVTDNGGGVVWYDALTNGNAFTDSELVQEGTYYADDSAGTCAIRSSIIIDFVVGETGNNLDAIYCSTDNATIQTYIDEVLQSEAPSGGSVEVYYDSALMNQAAGTDTLPNGGTNFFIVFVDNGGCRSQIEGGSTAVFTAPQDPTPPTPQDFCSDTNPTVGDLNAGSTDNVSWYANVDGNGDPILPALQLTTPLVDGENYFVQASDFFCTSNAVEVIVAIQDPFIAGTSGTLDYCNNNIPTADFNLFNELGGSPDTVGTWTGPLATSNGHLGTVNISTLTTPGVYTFTYTVPANGACLEDTATVTITIYETFISGTISVSSPATFCESGLPSAFDLTTLLDNEDPNGQWTEGLSSTDPVVTSPIDLSTYTPGTYNFTYTQNVLPNPCPEESTTVEVMVLQDPNAGNAVNQTFCENDLVANSPFDLFSALDDTQDNTSGTWTDGTGATVTNPIDITVLTVAGSPYTYNYTIDNGTCSDTEAITITIEPAPESGTVNGSPEFCQSAAPASFDLFDLLDGEDQTGVWYAGLDNTGAVTTNPVDLSILTSGTYNYTYDVDAIGTCDDELVTVTITINPLPNTGTATPVLLCENDPAINTPLDLFNQLSGNDAGGTWTDDNASGALTGNTVDLTLLAIGTYNYIYSITDGNSCTNSTTVNVTIEDAPESGEPLTPVEICISDLGTNSPFDLFTLLDGTQDTNGTWYDGADTTGTVQTNPIDITGLTVGTHNYTYSVPAIGNCTDVDVTVQIIINDLPNSGIASSIAFCENQLEANSPFDLFNQLSGNDAGGTWADDDTTGALSGSNVDLTLLTVGSYNFTYSITDGNSCTNSSTVDITIEEAPESGEALAPVEICEENVATNSPFDLFTLLDGTQDTNGTWYDGADTTGAVLTNPIDITGLTAGTHNYTYSVPPIGNCTDVDVTVQIIINATPNTGVATPIAFCENDAAMNSPFDLFSQLSGNDTGGTWTDDNASGALTGNTVNLTLLAIGTYNYTYTITDGSSCTSSSTVEITINDSPEAGTATPITICLIDVPNNTPLDLFSQLTGNDVGGTWTDDDTSGALAGNTVDLTLLTTGVYNYTYTVSTTFCPDDAETVTITISDTVAPTAMASQAFCDAATVGDLVAAGTTIQWYEEATGGIPLDAVVALVDGETYYATQTDANCESVTRVEVTVTINTTPNSGGVNTNTFNVCENDTAVDLTQGLDGTEDAGGTWYMGTDITGTVVTSPFDTTGLAPGDYDFTYEVTAIAPCVDATTTITLTIDAPLNAGTDAVLEICSNNGTTDLFTLIGTVDAGGAWVPALASGTGVFDPLVDPDGTYTYLLANGCGNFTSEVVVTVTQAPNAGGNAAITLCVIDGTIDLFTQLTGTPDTTGTWSPALASGTGVFDPEVDTAGTYTYTVAATGFCTTDATAEVTVTVNNSVPPTVVDANPVFCVTDNATVADLSASISTTGTIIWYTDATLTTVVNSTTALEDGEDYFATQTGTTGCESSVSVQIIATVSDAPTPVLANPELELCINDNPTINDLTINIAQYEPSQDNVIWYDSAVNGNVISSETLLTVGTTYYAVLVNTTTGCESSVPFEFTPDLTGCGLLTIPDGFSPNGDGNNETFDIDNVELLYPNFDMEIYNRYGNMVYKGNASTPRFDGTSNQPSIGKGDLPVGVYYYIFNYNDGITKAKQGRLYLSR
ncbi:T9SS type B sorting domain-containing protein [Pontimicrobium sp. MEBiC06410]